MRKIFEEIAASYSLTQEEIPDDDLDLVVPIRPAEALAAIQTLKDWEEQQDDSSHNVARQLKVIKKRVKALQISHLQQRTLDSYFYTNNLDGMKRLDRIVLGPFACKENSDENEVFDRIVPGAICV